MASTLLERNPSKLSELFDGCFAAEASVSTGFDPAERHLRLIVNGRPVDVTNAGIEPLRERKSSRGITAEDG